MLKVTIQWNFNASHFCNWLHSQAALILSKLSTKHHLSTSCSLLKFHHTYFDVVTQAYTTLLKCACTVCNYIFIHKHMLVNKICLQQII